LFIIQKQQALFIEDHIMSPLFALFLGLLALITADELKDSRQENQQPN